MTAIPPVDSPASAATIDSIVLKGGDRPRLVIAGIGAPALGALRGPRQDLPGTFEHHEGRFTATFPLLVSRWGGPMLPPPSGSYPLTLDADVEAVAPPVLLVPGLLRVEVATTSTGLALEITPPLDETERGSAAQAALEAEYRAAKPQPLDAVFFESFYGQSVTCNPLALDRELAATRPDVARYWSVVDASVEVPEGAVALIEGSAEWWRIRGAARLLVVNDWLRNRYRKRSFQTVLQTWHGTPLKKIALSRPGVGLRTALATIRERSRWSIMLSQNPHSTAVFRSAYAFLGPIWHEGYPRDDALVGGDGTAVRRRLGIADDVTVLLYAPTWRDDRPEHIDHLDVAAFTDALGPGYVTLIRGHSRTLRPGRDVRASNVIDVTGYPDVTELFLAADALITDYSSVMFDYSVTGKPIFLFTPDLEHYREQLRGFYFDIEKLAPGPVVQQAAELVALVRDRQRVSTEYAGKYADWQAKFNPRDDGRSSQRIVARLLERGAIG